MVTEGRRDGRHRGGLVDGPAVRPAGLPLPRSRGQAAAGGPEDVDLRRRAEQSEAWIRQRAAEMATQGAAASLDLAALDSPVWDEYRERARELDQEQGPRDAAEAGRRPFQPRAPPLMPQPPPSYGDGAPLARGPRSALADPPQPRQESRLRYTDHPAGTRPHKSGKRPRVGPLGSPARSEWTSGYAKLRQGGRRLELVEEEEEEEENKVCRVDEAGTVQKVRRMTKTYTCYEYAPQRPSDLHALVSRTPPDPTLGGSGTGYVVDGQRAGPVPTPRGLMTPHCKAILGRRLPAVTISGQGKRAPENLLQEVVAEDERDEGAPRVPQILGNSTGLHHHPWMSSAFQDDEYRTEDFLLDEELENSPIADAGPRYEEAWSTPPRTPYGGARVIGSQSPLTPTEAAPDTGGDVFVPASEGDMRDHFKRGPGLRWSPPPTLKSGSVKSLLSIVRGLR